MPTTSDGRKCTPPLRRPSRDIQPLELVYTYTVHTQSLACMKAQAQACICTHTITRSHESTGTSHGTNINSSKTHLGARVCMSAKTHKGECCQLHVPIHPKCYPAAQNCNALASNLIHTSSHKTSSMHLQPTLHPAGCV